MSGGVKTGTKPVQSPAPTPRPAPAPAAAPGTKPVGNVTPKPTAHLDMAQFKAGQAPKSDHDDLKAKVEAARKAQAAHGHGEHPKGDDHDTDGEDGDHGDGHHAHHPGQIAGEAGRSANHLSHGAQGLKSAAQEAQVLKSAAQEAQALKAAAQEAEALAAAAREAQAVKNVVNVAQGAGRVAGVAEAGLEAAKDAAEGARAAQAASAKTPKPASHAGAHGHGPSKLGKGLGVIGIAGGGIQIAVGVGQLRNGETGEGVKNLVVGGGFAGSGVAELTLASKVATKVAAPLAGGASVIEGGYDVYKGIKHGDGKKVALGGAKGIGGALLAASPFVTGSVVGAPVGVVMAIAGTTLIAGAAIVENWDTLKGWAKSGAKAVGNVASKAWEGTKNLASSAWDGAKSLFSGW